MPQFCGLAGFLVEYIRHVSGSLTFNPTGVSYIFCLKINKIKNTYFQ